MGFIKAMKKPWSFYSTFTFFFFSSISSRSSFRCPHTQTDRQTALVSPFLGTRERESILVLPNRPKSFECSHLADVKSHTAWVKILLNVVCQEERGEEWKGNCLLCAFLSVFFFQRGKCHVPTANPTIQPKNLKFFSFLSRNVRQDSNWRSKTSSSREIQKCVCVCLWLYLKTRLYSKLIEHRQINRWVDRKMLFLPQMQLSCFSVQHTRGWRPRQVSATTTTAVVVTTKNLWTKKSKKVEWNPFFWKNVFYFKSRKMKENERRKPRKLMARWYRQYIIKSGASAWWGLKWGREWRCEERGDCTEWRKKTHSLYEIKSKWPTCKKGIKGMLGEGVVVDGLGGELYKIITCGHESSQGRKLDP